MKMSSLRNRFANNEFGDSCWLLGDSGYSLKKWLMTPFGTPISACEKKFNLLHRKTRRVIEQAFGVLKSRWRILDHTGGSLCCSPAKVSKIAITCCVLHNICRRNGTPIIGEDCFVPPLVIEDSDSPEHLQLDCSGIAQRQTIVDILQ